MKERFASALKNGVVDNNPVLVQMLGMCPILAKSTSSLDAFGMGLAVTISA